MVTPFYKMYDPVASSVRQGTDSFGSRMTTVREKTVTTALVAACASALFPGVVLLLFRVPLGCPAARGHETLLQRLCDTGWMR